MPTSKWHTGSCTRPSAICLRSGCSASGPRSSSVTRRCAHAPVRRGPERWLRRVPSWLTRRCSCSTRASGSRPPRTRCARPWGSRRWTIGASTPRASRRSHARSTRCPPCSSERGERERQRGNLERSQESLRSQALSLETSVRQAHREAVLSQDALRAMHELVDAAREQARIGRLEYQAGRTTAYDLVGIEADLARAELRESQVLVRMARSLVELDRL